MEVCNLLGFLGKAAVCFAAAKLMKSNFIAGYVRILSKYAPTTA